MEIKLFNTMGRKKEVFKPIKSGKVKLYACGPTVYSYAHIGHFRAYVFVDVLRRMIKFNRLKLTHVMNITDVGHLTDDADQGEDKIEKAAKKESKTVWEIAEFYIKDFFDAMEKLNVQKPEIICKATDHIQEMIDLVKKIESNGYTYRTSDGIYFDTSKLSDYGKLAGLDIEGLKEGARVEKNPEKKNPTDFALWKFAKEGEKRQMEWDSPWGPHSFPGWHIECTAMSMKYLGEVYDIHTGGVDHISVHHTNEIAQAQGTIGKDFVNYWLHNEFVNIDGEKMSKSKGNIYNMNDIEEKGFDPLAVRYLFLTAHYRSKINFTWGSLKAAENTLNTLREHIRLFQEKDDKKSDQNKVGEYRGKFLEFINDDLNTTEALSLMWKLIRDEKNINNKDKYELILDFDKVFGLKLDEIKLEEKIPENIRQLIDDREKAREKKDYRKADKIREKIREMGFKLQDTKKEVKVRKI
ncbi:MAG: cysteine--tRNA ligase [Candidatus Aenigmarchaeota archaeon]|nr:cysteine--tRNA ligase [Candidatus Aenigmarchaeota archaeon]